MTETETTTCDLCGVVIPENQASPSYIRGTEMDICVNCGAQIQAFIPQIQTASLQAQNLPIPAKLASIPTFQ